MSFDMKEIMVWGKSLPEAYHSALDLLKKEGEICDCPDWDTMQKEASMTIIVKEPLREPMISKLFIGGPEDLEQYRQEMIDGILDFEIERGNWDYTYHDRITNWGRFYIGDDTLFECGLNQVQFVVDELKRNPYSRRAVIDVRNNFEDENSDDPACLQNIQYFIRDEKLNCKVLFRSNDACKATFMNMFALVMLQKKIADEIGVPVGMYVHRANSFHCYERDFEMLDGYVKRIAENAPAPENLCYEYDGDWKDMMEEAKGEIRKKVECLMR